MCDKPSTCRLGVRPSGRWAGEKLNGSPACLPLVAPCGEMQGGQVEREKSEGVNLCGCWYFGYGEGAELKQTKELGTSAL